MYGKNGVGASLRSQHFSAFLGDNKPGVDWIEIVADQYLNSYGVLREKLQAISASYPTSMHCLSLSVGGLDKLEQKYLQQLQELADLINPEYISDHLCWVTYQGRYSHDLLPLPYSAALCDHIAPRIDQVQEVLKRPFLLENISHYVPLTANQHLCEAATLNQLCAETGCGILLDINNVYVSASNLGCNADDFLAMLNPKYVQQIHLAGYSKTEHRLVDTHGERVHAPVWELLRQALRRFGPVACCIEWDSDIPSWDVLQNEVDLARACLQENNVATLDYQSASSCLPKQGPVLEDFQDRFWHLVHSAQDIPLVRPESVYQNSIRAQRQSALAQVYPVCMHLLGQELFAKIAVDYFQQTPSLAADITAGYDTFIKYMATLPEITLSLLELAQYEWLWYCCFHGPNNEAIEVESLAARIAQQGQDILLSLPRGLLFYCCQYPVLELWESAQVGYEGPAYSNKQAQYYYALHQRHAYVLTLSITKADYQCLSLLNQSMSLQQWCDDCSKLEDFNPDQIAYYYQHGLIQLATKKDLSYETSYRCLSQTI